MTQGTSHSRRGRVNIHINGLIHSVLGSVVLAVQTSSNYQFSCSRLCLVLRVALHHYLRYRAHSQNYLITAHYFTFISISVPCYPPCCLICHHHSWEASITCLSLCLRMIQKQGDRWRSEVNGHSSLQSWASGTRFLGDLWSKTTKKVQYTSLRNNGSSCAILRRATLWEQS